MAYSNISKHNINNPNRKKNPVSSEEIQTAYSDLIQFSGEGLVTKNTALLMVRRPTLNKLQK